MIGTAFYWFFCSICGDRISNGENECDWCWYGMRMDPKGWKALLRERGIKVVRGMGCMPFGDGYICGNPYRKKGAKI